MNLKKYFEFLRINWKIICLWIVGSFCCNIKPFLKRTYKSSYNRFLIPVWNHLSKQQTIYAFKGFPRVSGINKEPVQLQVLVPTNQEPSWFDLIHYSFQIFGPCLKQKPADFRNRIWHLVHGSISTMVIMKEPFRSPCFKGCEIIDCKTRKSGQFNILNETQCMKHFWGCFSSLVYGRCVVTMSSPEGCLEEVPGDF